jgi:aminopeptidase-like protein
MVGAKRSHFYREGLSQQYAPSIVDKIWSMAARLGFSDYFVKQNVPEITDDHYFMNTAGKIPTVDIVDYQPGVGFFGDYHHTQKDNLELISKETLLAVGTTLMNVVYYEESLLPNILLKCLVLPLIQHFARQRLEVFIRYF